VRPTWERDTGPLLGEDAVESLEEEEEEEDEPVLASAPEPAGRVPEPDVPAPLVEASIAETAPEPDVGLRPPLPVSPPPIEPPPPVEPERVELPPLAPPPAPPARETVPLITPTPTRITSAPVTPRVSRPDEVEALLDEDYGVDPITIPGRPRPERRTVGAGPWLAAIAVTVALAILAAVLISRGQGIIGTGGDLPAPEEVQTRVARVFENMKSLKTSFSIRRLSIYRTGGQQGSLVYSFANGEYSGRFVYDRSEGYRQEVTLTINDREVDRAKIVQTSDETRSLLGSATNDLIVERRPPLGPPDGQLRPALGVLEEALGEVVQTIVTSDNLEVVGRTSEDGRDLYQIRTSITPDELTRADQLDVLLDVSTFFPAVIRRSIGRVDAGVLGPSDVLTDDAIAKAFGDRDRITTERVELDNVLLDDIVLPGDFVLDAGGAQPQSRDSQFERVTRAEVAGRLPFKPLFPRALPEGFKEQSIAVFAGEQRGWGPGGRYAAPDGVMHASYFDGKTTIVITERNVPSGPFALEGSPLQSGALPITVRPYEREAKRLFYGVSPETPPHAYGFLGNVFVMVVGYAPADDLIGILASLGEVPAVAPAPGGPSPSPGATSSPAASPAGSPAGSLPGDEP
jgi:hypothetical protein